MKIKNLLFGMLACTALVGCSSDDEPNVPVSGESYVAINIVSPGGSSRAEAGGYEVGSEQENAAEKALFVFFDKKQYAIFRVNTFNNKIEQKKSTNATAPHLIFNDKLYLTFFFFFPILDGCFRISLKTRKPYFLH